MTAKHACDTLFWSMLLVGGVSLAACLILPAWLEYEDARQRWFEAQARNERLRQQVENRTYQIEHLYHDREYLSRVAAEEFPVSVPGIRRIRLDLPGFDSQRAAESAPRSSLDCSPAADAPADRLRWVLRGHALASVFVFEPARRIALMLSAMLLLAALLLGLPPRAQDAAQQQGRDHQAAAASAARQTTAHSRPRI